MPLLLAQIVIVQIRLVLRRQTMRWLPNVQSAETTSSGITSSSAGGVLVTISQTGDFLVIRTLKCLA